MYVCVCVCVKQTHQLTLALGVQDETRGWFDEAVPEADRLKEPAAKPKPAAASSAGGAWSTTASKGSGGGGVVRPGGQTRSSSNPWAALG